MTDETPRPDRTIERRNLAKRTFERFVSQPQKQIKEMEHKLTHDSHTGLLNLRGFEEVVVPQAELALRTGTPMVIGFVDMDKLKAVNDSFGHAKGDEVILLLSDTLRKHFKRQTDIIAQDHNRGDDKGDQDQNGVLARKGDSSDEFYLALPISEPETVPIFLEEARKEFEEEGKKLTGGVEVSFSVGLSNLGEKLNIPYSKEAVQSGDLEVVKDGDAKVSGSDAVLNSLHVAEMRMYANKIERKQGRL